MTLLESTGKKVEFLEAVIALLGLGGVEAIAERAETLAHAPTHREGYDAAFARALAPLPVLLELTLPFLRVGGLLVTQRRGDLAAEVAAAALACRTLGGAPPRIEPVMVPPLDDGRALVVVEKVAATPAAYPRRPGVTGEAPARRHLNRVGIHSAAATRCYHAGTLRWPLEQPWHRHIGFASAWSCLPNCAPRRIVPCEQAGRVAGTISLSRHFATNSRPRSVRLSTLRSPSWRMTSTIWQRRRRSRRSSR